MGLHGRVGSKLAQLGEWGNSRGVGKSGRRRGKVGVKSKFGGESSNRTKHTLKQGRRGLMDECLQWWLVFVTYFYQPAGPVEWVDLLGPKF